MHFMDIREVDNGLETMALAHSHYRQPLLHCGMRDDQGCRPESQPQIHLQSEIAALS